MLHYALWLIRRIHDDGLIGLIIDDKINIGGDCTKAHLIQMHIKPLLNPLNIQHAFHTAHFADNRIQKFNTDDFETDADRCLSLLAGTAVK